MGGVVGSSSTGCLRVKQYEQQIMMQTSSCQPDKTFCTLVRLGLSHSGLETSWQPVVEKGKNKVFPTGWWTVAGVYWQLQDKIGWVYSAAPTTFLWLLWSDYCGHLSATHCQLLTEQWCKSKKEMLTFKTKVVPFVLVSVLRPNVYFEGKNSQF